MNLDILPIAIAGAFAVVAFLFWLDGAGKGKW